MHSHVTLVVTCGDITKTSPSSCTHCFVANSTSSSQLLNLFGGLAHLQNPRTNEAAPPLRFWQGWELRTLVPSISALSAARSWGITVRVRDVVGSRNKKEKSE